MKKSALEKSLLESMYYEKKMSLREIGKELSFSASQVGRMLKKFNEKKYQIEKEKRNYGKKQVNPEELALKFIRLFEAGMTMKVIAEKFDYTPEWVSKVLNKYERETLEKIKQKKREERAKRFKKSQIDMAIESTMKEQHRAATSELSYKSQLSGSVMWKILSSAYKTTATGFRRKTEKEMKCVLPLGMPKYIKNAIQYSKDSIGGKRNNVSGKIKPLLT